MLLAKLANMQKVVLVVYFLFCIVDWGFAQTENESSEILENIHLHLNKTIFIKGERLWFKAYVQNQQNKLPSLKTTNLHVAIYDNKGGEVKRKLFYAQNGMANGDFAIDSIFTGQYYKILAWTNYQRNFEQLKPFQQHIEIVREATEEVNHINEQFKIEVYPEGGYLIEDAFNQIGIVLSRPTGERVSFNNLELLDGLGNVVRSNIATNSLGLGKVGFTVEKGKGYFLQWGNTDIGYSRKSLPKPKSNVIGLNIDNNGKDNVLVKLIASKQTFKEKDGENYSMAIYQDDTILFEDVEIAEEESVLSLQRKSMPYGINTVVLFDSELKPVSRRMFFNHRQDKERLQSIQAEYCLNDFGDSIQIDLIRPNNSLMQANVSMSALPGSSRAYQPENSIASSFIVRPYLRKPFKGSYYFDDMDRKKRFELDKRLLIEGWGTYDWDSRKFEKLKLEFAIEVGIPISGKIVDADLIEENKVSLVTDFSGAYAFEELSSDKTFKRKMNLFEGDSLGISLMGKKGKLRKPKAEIQFSNVTSLTGENDKWLNFEQVIPQKQVDEIVEKDQALDLGERTIALDEVSVTEKALKTKKIPMFVPRGSLLPISEGRIIGDSEIKKYQSVRVYLSTLGYSIGRALDADGFYIEALLSPKSNKMVFYTGSLNWPLSRVQAIYFDVDKEVYVNIVPRLKDYETPEQRNKFLKFAIENGYTRPQEYFTPNYPDNTTSIFKNYGALDWKANISIGFEIPTTVLIPIKEQRTIIFFVEGMDANGELFTQSETIITTKID